MDMPTSVSGKDFKIRVKDIFRCHLIHILSLRPFEDIFILLACACHECHISQVLVDNVEYLTDVKFTVIKKKKKSHSLPLVGERKGKNLQQILQTQNQILLLAVDK